MLSFTSKKRPLFPFKGGGVLGLGGLGLMGNAPLKEFLLKLSANY